MNYPAGQSACDTDSGSKLKKAASQLFAQKWYGTVSVAEICRQAGLSNGCFYRYYSNKEKLFHALLEEINHSIASALEAVSGDTPLQRLRSFAAIVFNYSQDNRESVRIFREGQYRFYEYERGLKEIYIAALEKALGGPVSPAEYVFVLGGLRFSAVRRAFYATPLRLDALQRILEGGLFDGMKTDPDKVYAAQLTLIQDGAAPDAAERLLAEGKKLFGKHGYFETNIYQITEAAGLSVGAFYTYFEGKEAFYAALIRRVSQEVRHFIALNMGRGLNRLERELRGIWLFAIFLSLDPYCYSIVREAEFVLPDDVRQYYNDFAQGYKNNPEGSGGLDEDSSISFLLGVAHYFGLEIVFDGSFSNARSQVEKIGELLRKGLSVRLFRKEEI